MLRTPKIFIALSAATALFGMQACTSTGVPEVVGQTTSASPSAAALGTLGPNGLGPLTLGMTPDQVRATKLVEDFTTPGNGCVFAAFKDAPKSDQVDVSSVVLSPDLGLVAIAAWGTIATPEGLRVGDTYDKAHTLYPDWTGIGGHTGHGLVAVPGNPAANYRIDIDENGTVDSVTLQAANQDCYE